MSPSRRPHGINLVGYLRAEAGVGEAARLYATAIERAGIPYVTIAYGRTPSRQTHAFDAGALNDAPYDTTILCVNADQLANFAADAGPHFFEDRYTIGVWMWEVEPFPATMFDGFDYVDEIWVASDHAAGAVGAVSSKPVVTISPPLSVPSVTPRSREGLGLPDGFAYLFVFDFLSVFERKNPLDLIEAFTRAFAPGEGPSLVIKSANGDKRPDRLERLRERVAAHPDVYLIEDYFSPDDRIALMAACDAYVSMHRSEGLGLTMAEAMAIGKPVIATAYSGNLVFMNDANSYLIPYRPVEIPSGAPPYPVGGTWAQPDIDAAAALMRRLYEHPDEATRKGRQAQEDIRTRHTPEACAAVIADRLDRVRRWRAQSAYPTVRVAPAAHRAPRPDIDRARWHAVEIRREVPALDRAEQLLREGPSTAERSRFGPIGRGARRALLRLLRPYSRHQRRVSAALAESMRELHRRQAASAPAIHTIMWLSDRIGSLQAEVGRLRAVAESSTDDVTRRIDSLRSEITAIESAVAALRRHLEDSSVIS